VEQFANRFVPQARVLTARLVSAQRWAEIDPYHMDAVAVRKEIAKFDPEFIRMLYDLVKLTGDCKPPLDDNESPNAVPDDQANEQRIAAALGEMTALIKECTQEYERWAALPNRV
jgi:hypothetical protein